ncbi:MAG: hypothetical protein H7250_01460 [Flavobacterium sp.]|nr:hypothetical protein [Flavobacterium sp.]
MEQSKIEFILKKYFEGETNIVEENELRTYFSSTDVAQHLQQYQSLFKYYNAEKKQKIELKSPLNLISQTKNRKLKWLSIAASIVVLIGACTFTFFNYNNSQQQDLGSYDSPEEAFAATQKALNLLSENVNVGVISVQHIQEFENSKNLIFKK